MDDIRDVDPASWPYGNEPPPAQVQLQHRRAASGPQRVPSFTPTGPQQRLAVTAAQPQAPAQPMQVREHPAGTFTGLSPWQQWARRAQARPYPAPGRETPFYNGMLRDRRSLMASAAPPAEPYTLAPPAHESWQARQRLAMLPLPGCDYPGYMARVDRLTGTRGGLDRATAEGPAAIGWDAGGQWQALAGAVAAAGSACEETRPGKARAYARLAGYVGDAPDYATALALVRAAAGCGLTVPGYTAPRQARKAITSGGAR